MTHGSLFSGIGGFDLAAEWAGFENAFQVEIDKFCQKVLSKNFPNVKKYLDIKDFNGTEYKGRIDIVSGGFPCQPFSVAGKRRGTEDDRWLWGEMLRVISEVEPSWVIAENVRGLVSLDGGVVFRQVLSDLENIGYEVQPFVIPACAKNAPHRRDRIWIVANKPDSGVRRSESKECGVYQREVSTQEQSRSKLGSENEGCDREFNPNTDGERFKTLDKGIQPNEEGRHHGQDYEFNPNSERGKFRGLRNESKTQRTRFGDELSGNQFGFSWIEVATEFCRVDDGIPNRVDRLKSLGNAIVPQVAFEIFKSIKLIEMKTNKED